MNECPLSEALFVWCSNWESSVLVQNLEAVRTSEAHNV